MLAVARRNAARQGWSNAFDRPWRHLEHLTEDVRVREVGLGAGYLMTGRVPSRAGPVTPPGGRPLKTPQPRLRSPPPRRRGSRR